MTLFEVRNRAVCLLSSTYTKSESEVLFRRLVSDLMRIDGVRFFLNLEEEVEKKQLALLMNCIDQLVASKPIQYLLGYEIFLGMKLSVCQGVLIPRPETEELILHILNKYKYIKSPLKVLDVGTGSGCIAIALAKHQPYFEVDAIDISSDAIELASKNAKEQGVSINFFKEDILEKGHLDMPYDLIVSNPPYVLHEEKKDMFSNVLDYEPHMAIFVKEPSSPIYFYRHLIGLANIGTQLYFEINPRTKKLMDDMLFKEGIRTYSYHKDFRDKDRFLILLKD